MMNGSSYIVRMENARDREPRAKFLHMVNRREPSALDSGSVRKPIRAIAEPIRAPLILAASEPKSVQAEERATSILQADERE